MSQNPYQSPAASSTALGVNSGRREDLRSVAKFQRGIMICILAYVVAFACQFAVPEGLRMVLLAAMFIVSITATVFVFLLAMKVYSTGLGVLLGILTLVPCIGLVVLLIVNAKATKILKQNGVKVGIMGADPSTI